MGLVRIQQLSEKVIASVESSKIPFYQTMFIFAASYFVRAFLEGRVGKGGVYNAPSSFVSLSIFDAFFFFLCVALLSAIVISLAVKVPINKVLRIFFVGGVLIMVPPVVDIVHSLGDGVYIRYIFADRGIDVWRAYFSLGSSYEYISLGQQVSIILIMATTWLYCFAKGAGVIKSAVLALVVYSIAFLFGCTPYIIKFLLNLLGFPYLESIISIVWFYLVVTTALIVFVCYLADKKIFFALMRDMCVSRIVYYELSFMLGAALAVFSLGVNLQPYIYLYPDLVMSAILTMISIFFAGMFSLICNNINDVEIDKISNSSRPLVSGVINMHQYQVFSFIFIASALFYAGMVNSKVFVIIATVMSTYYLYSVPPIRFKRVTVLSKLVIGLNSYAIIFLGYILMRGGADDFPVALAWFCFVGITLSANFIDLKDIAGDKAGGILTLPILIGEKNAKRLIGVAFFLLIMSSYFIMHDYRLLPALAVWGAVFYYVINMANYKDWIVMWLCNINLLALIIYFISQSGGI